jgi:hypothetical protein
MASLRIPKKHYEGLAKFLSLPEEAFEEFTTHLQEAPIALDFRQAIRKSILGIQDISPDDAERMVDALVSLYLAKATSENSTPAFVDELTQAIEESNANELKIADEFRGSIGNRLNALLGREALTIASKANSIMYEYGNVYYRARILTDIRPIFGDSPDSIEAAVVIHNLRIHYHEGDVHKDFFVALDTQDIQKLIDVLQRAKTKAESLKTLLAKTNIPYIEPEER